jgi:hypothetical protein
MERLVRNPDVVATELEDGAVLLNLQSGFYYSLNSSGLEVWRLAEVDPERALSAAAGFVELLEREALLVRTDQEPNATGRMADSGDERPITEPELVKHDEPLHEVSMSPFDPQLPLAE